MNNEEEDIAALRKFVRDNREHLSWVRSGLKDLNVAVTRQEARVDELASGDKSNSAVRPQPDPARAQERPLN